MPGQPQFGPPQGYPQAHPQGGYPPQGPGQPPYGPPPHGPGGPQGQGGGRSGGKIALVVGAAVLGLALVAGTIVLLTVDLGGSGDPVASEDTEEGEDEETGGEESGAEAAAGSGPGSEVFTGGRNELIELDEPHTDARLVTIESDGHVAIEMRNAEGDQVEHVANMGEDGKAPYNHGMYPNEITQLDVRSEADSWTITTEPLENAESWDDPDEPLEGSGNDVVQVSWDTSDVEIDVEYSGESNFVIWASADDGSSDLLVNEIGDYSSTETMPDGTTLLHVESQGEWSLTPS